MNSVLGTRCRLLYAAINDRPLTCDLFEEGKGQLRERMCVVLFLVVVKLAHRFLV